MLIVGVWQFFKTLSSINILCKRIPNAVKPEVRNKRASCCRGCVTPMLTCDRVPSGRILPVKPTRTTLMSKAHSNTCFWGFIFLIHTLTHYLGSLISFRHNVELKLQCTEIVCYSVEITVNSSACVDINEILLQSRILASFQ